MGHSRSSRQHLELIRTSSLSPRCLRHQPRPSSAVLDASSRVSPRFHVCCAQDGSCECSPIAMLSIVYVGTSLQITERLQRARVVIPHGLARQRHHMRHPSELIRSTHTSTSRERWRLSPSCRASWGRSRAGAARHVPSTRTAVIVCRPSHLKGVVFRACRAILHTLSTEPCDR